MRIGVYVGSFNPIHKGHIALVNHLLNNNYVDKVIIIPTLNYWDKNNLISLNHRINMLKFYESDRIIINTELGELPYTSLVIDKLDSKDELYLIIGADNLIKFELWKDIEKILEHHVLVIPRDDIDAYFYINKYKEKDSFKVIDDFKTICISSTVIRNKVKEKDTDINELLDLKVINYINNNNLYN